MGAERRGSGGALGRSGLTARGSGTWVLAFSLREQCTMSYTPFHVLHFTILKEKRLKITGVKRRLQARGSPGSRRRVAGDTDHGAWGTVGPTATRALRSRSRDSAQPVVEDQERAHADCESHGPEWAPSQESRARLAGLHLPEEGVSSLFAQTYSS